MLAGHRELMDGIRLFLEGFLEEVSLLETGRVAQSFVPGPHLLFSIHPDS